MTTDKDEPIKANDSDDVSQLLATAMARSIAEGETVTVEAPPRLAAELARVLHQQGEVEDVDGAREFSGTANEIARWCVRVVETA